MAVTQTDLDNSTLMKINELNANDIKKALLTADGIGHFATLADFKASTKVYDTVHIDGYYSADDGAFGSNNHYLLPDDGTVYTEQGGVVVQTASGRWYKLKFNGEIHSKYFGIIGDGSDESLKVQAWLNSLSLKNKLIGDGITVLITTPITIPLIDGSNIDFKDMKFISNGSITSSEKYFSNTSSFVEFSATLTEDISINDYSATFSDSSEFAVGDILSISGNGLDNGSGIRAYDGDIMEVHHIIDNIVYFKESFSVDIDIAELTKIRKYSMCKNITISNISVVASGERDVLFEMRQICDSNLSRINLSANTTGLIGLSVQDSSNVTIEKCKIKDFQDNPSNSIGYGIVVNGRYITIQNNDVRNCKHNLTSGGYLYASRAINYLYNRTSGAIMASLDYHYNVIDSMMVGNNVETSALGINIRNQGRVKVLSNFISSESSAILIYSDVNTNTINNSGTTKDIIISDNTLNTSSNNTSRIIDFIYAADILENIKIKNNTVNIHSTNPFVGMSKQISKNVEVSHNTVNGGGLFLMPNGVKISHNTLNNPSASYIVVMANNDYADNVIVTYNTVNNIGSQSFIRATNGKSITQYGNTINGSASAYNLDIRIPVSMRPSIEDFGISPSADDCSTNLQKCVENYNTIYNRRQDRYTNDGRGTAPKIQIKVPEGRYVIDGSYNFNNTNVEFYSVGTVDLDGSNANMPTIKNVLI